MKLLFNILLLTLSAGTLAQTVSSDSVKTDSVKNLYMPTGIRIGTDVLALVKSQFQDDFSGWEINADVDFYRYYLAVDYGSWSRKYPGDSASYANSGNYWRVGADVNFLTKDVERNMFFIGVRYGHSRYSEDFDVIVSDPIWGDRSLQYTNNNITSRWYELTTGIKVKMWKSIWMGYTARFKFGLKSSGADAMLPHDVPGYGRTDGATSWGFNYQIFYRIPFRKMPPLPPSKKK